MLGKCRYDLAVPTFHTQRLKRVPISPFNYVTYRAFIMFEGARYIGHNFEDEGRA